MPLYGPKFPLSAGNHDTFELYDDVHQQINFYLKNLILTSPGENISDPRYGVGLRRFLFEQNLQSTRQEISSAISNQISKYLPYLTVSEIQVSASATEIDSNSLTIKIIYSLLGDEELQIFDLNTEPATTIGFY